MTQPLSESPVNFTQVEFETSATKPSAYPPPDLPEVAVIGRSNVGKSSLLNSLFQRHSLVKVSRTPGRTQLINFFCVDQRLRIVDLPGYGFAKVPESVRRQWRPMIERYLETRTSLVACFLLLDIRRIPSEDDLDMWYWLQHSERLTIPIATKSDKLSAQQRKNQLQHIADLLAIPTDGIVVASAKTHAGRDKLRSILTSLCWNPSPPTPPEES